MKQRKGKEVSSLVWTLGFSKASEKDNLLKGYLLFLK